MKIGFEAKRLFNNFTGLGNYSRTLVSALNHIEPEHQLFLFTPKKKYHPETREFFKNPYQIVIPKTKFKNAWRTKYVTKDIKNLKLDIFHGLSHELPIGIKQTGAKSLVTIHDLIYKTYPHDFSLIDRLIYNFKFRYACKNADKIIAVSQSTKNDIRKFYNIPEDKIEVIYQSCHNQFKEQLAPDIIEKALAAYNLPNEFLLYVGSVIERKNLLNLVKAIESIKGELKMPLVVVGNGNTYLKKVKLYVQQHQLQKWVIFAQPIAFEHLPALYQKATVFIYPSVYEGFGIPIIEALWSKTPVITSNCSSMPEAAGPGAFLCDPFQPESIATGIRKILNEKSYANQLMNDGFEYIKKFDNQVLMQQLLTIYKNLIDKNSP